MMKPIIPSTKLFWWLDDDAVIIQNLSQQLSQLASDCEVTPFSRAEDAEQTLVMESPDRYPWAFITDMEGVEPDRTGQSTSGRLLKVSPLSMVMLYSGRAVIYPDLVPPLFEKQWIHDFTRKPDHRKMLQKIEEWRIRWDRPVPCAIREYIPRSRFAPTIPFFKVLKDQYLSLNDLHREIVLGTEAGRQAERAWAKMMEMREAMAHV